MDISEDLDLLEGIDPIEVRLNEFLYCSMCLSEYIIKKNQTKR